MMSTATAWDEPLSVILREVLTAVDAKLYYLALVSALSLPDFCVSLECAPGAIWTNQAKYEAWCETYVVPRFISGNVTANDLYRVRCGVVHNGNFGRANARYDRILFTPGGAIDETICKNNGGIIESALILSLPRFCGHIVDAVRGWVEQNRDNQNVIANMPDVVRMRPMGLAPHVVGVPLIA